MTNKINDLELDKVAGGVGNDNSGSTYNIAVKTTIGKAMGDTYNALEEEQKSKNMPYEERLSNAKFLQQLKSDLSGIEFLYRSHTRPCTVTITFFADGHVYDIVVTS